MRSNEQVQQVRAVSGGGGGGGGSAASPPLSQPQQQGSASGQQHKIMTTEFRTNGNSEAHRGGGGGGGGNGKRQITKPSSGNRRGDSSRSPTSSRRGDSSRSPTASISSRQKSLSPSPFSLPRNNTTTAAAAAGNGNGGSRAPSSSTNASRAWDFVPRGPPKVCPAFYDCLFIFIFIFILVGYTRLFKYIKGIKPSNTPFFSLSNPEREKKKKRKKKGGGGLEIEVLVMNQIIGHFLVILPLALCWKHDSKKPFLTQLLNKSDMTKNTQIQNVKFDTKKETHDISKHYLV